MINLISKHTIQKFDKPGPRYTSYPTAPEWSDTLDENIYFDKLQSFGLSNKTLSLYVHIPFCESMCTFCACNTIIRPKDEKYADEYLSYLFKEIELISSHINGKPKVRQLHWGGGTPTFLTNNQIERLFHKIEEHFSIDFTSEVAIELDPRTIDESKIKLLKKLGFNRISMGVQDVDEKVQMAINRIQPFNMLKDIYEICRQQNFQSINFDLIYGLPYQSKETFSKTIKEIISLKPDRIALYSFAYLPWLKKHQSKISESNLPSAESKLDIFLNAAEQFINHEYDAIAMDHFALKTDELAAAFRNGKLYRNFMGYTVKPADEYLGVGLSAIGFLENTFIQNNKLIKTYYSMLSNNKLPIERGKILTEDDIIRQWTINSFMCNFTLDKIEFFNKFSVSFDEYFKEEHDHLNQCKNDGLLTENEFEFRVTQLGKIFIRNVCMGFDYYLRQKNSHQKFSRTV